MDIRTFSKQLEARMNEGLTNVDVTADAISAVGQAITCIQNVIAELKEFAVNYEFAETAEEITFFKEIKPAFVSQWLFHRKVLTIRVFNSFRNATAKQENYQRILNREERYLRKNLDFYEYWTTNKTHLDTPYFTRNTETFRSVNSDDRFSSSGDGKVSRILAGQMLRNFLFGLLTRTSDDKSGVPRSLLNWTKPKTDLVELIYALHSSESVNNGEVPLKHIASAFEQLFNVNLGDYYRTFQDIAIRKKNPTPFLDTLKVAFTRRIDKY